MFLRYLTIFIVSFLFSSVIFAETIILKNNLWVIEINPSTLETKSVLPSGSSVSLSMPVKNFKVKDVATLKNESSWIIDENIKVKATLIDNKLVFGFTSKTATNITWPVVLKQGEGLILPLKEGYYINNNDAIWQDALKKEYSGINTTEDLSLPAIGLDLKDKVISILFISPFNNKINFLNKTNNLLDVTHEFTELDKEKYYEVQIILSNTKDLLAPAKEYRKWLIDNNKFVPLEQKLSKSKDGEKIIGASHIYLWGERLITPPDVKDWTLLQKTLLSKNWFNDDSWLNSEAKKALKEKDLSKKPYMQSSLINAIESYLQKEVSGYSFEDIEKRKNLLLNTLGQSLNAEETWGDANSPKVINLLKDAGLKNIWLGYPQWTAGFTNPKGVDKAIELGYLISPYDSYDTALPEKNSNKSWLTAQMGNQVFKDCGIVLKDGKRKTGFQNEGVYTNTACIRSVLEKRVDYLLSVNPYNSWFLDVDATGMVFDDYNPKNPTTQEQDAKNRIDTMAIVAKKGLILGSEVGGAVVNSPIVFAHGMQTSGFGWNDEDMRKNAKSPYFLGAWFPDYQPQHFFKSASVKAKYKHLYFNPKNRLPLFQTAFHDSVITTHHWTVDSLKFNEVRMETELLQMLYNVPPLLNISLQTANKRIEYLKTLDEFFNPLHKQLYNQALVDFKWLDKDGMIQQTTFSNGVKIIANFNGKEAKVENKVIPKNSVMAILTNGSTKVFSSPNVKVSSAYYSN